MILKDRFYTLLKNYTTPENTTILWSQIHSAYTEKHRKYHNLNHLEELFSYYNQYCDAIQNKEAVCLAIFYHDFIYEVWKKDNEEKSAEKAIKILQELDFPLDQFKVIEDLILCTKNHASLTSDQGFMIDFDLAILGQSKSIYTEYTQQIREEYKIVPDFIYKKGRKKVLHHFLEKESIFQTNIFKTQFEAQARININKELKVL